MVGASSISTSVGVSLYPHDVKGPRGQVKAEKGLLHRLGVLATRRLGDETCSARPRRAARPASLRVHLRLFLLLLIAASPALAEGPAGNDLPGEAAPHDSHAGHDHGPGVTHGPPSTSAAALDPHAGHDHAAMTRAQHQAFAASVDLDAVRKLAVFDQGRVKILDTLAAEQLTRIYGKPRWKDVSAATAGLPPGQREDVTYDPVFTYLDLVFNRGYYADKPILYVEVLPFRERLIAHLPEDERERWKKLGRISVDLFTSPQVRDALRAADTDIVEGKARNQLFTAVNAFAAAGEDLLLISPEPGDVQWARVDTLDADGTGGAETGIVPAGFGVRAATVPDLWNALAGAWSHGDAETVNSLLTQLTAAIPAVHPSTYPPAYRLSLEYLYNATYKFTIGYALYAVATLLLVLALTTGRLWLTVSGVVFLLLGLLAHAGSFAIRAVLSERWAIHNQFESFIALSLFAVLIGIVFMFARRQWVFGAAAAALGTLSLLTANLWAIPSHEVGQVAGILDTSRILYVHVNMVLVSYGLIALSFFVSLAYLAAHYLPGRYAAQLAGAGGAGFSPRDVDDAPRPPSRKAALHDLDKAQLVLMQLAFWLLGTGIMLGAYWADHAWGRWWAWDPKETWALITWIVYLIAIHARFGVKDRGLTTAWLSVAGFVVMLWTYWGVNLLLAGLHSYA